MTDAARMYRPLAAEEVKSAEAAGTNAANSRTKPDPIVPVPEDARPMQYRHREHGVPSNAWPYHDADSRVVGYSGSALSRSAE